MIFRFGKLTATVVLDDGLTLDRLNCPRIVDRRQFPGNASS